MCKLKKGQAIYYKDWQNNDKLIPARVVRCKKAYCYIDVLKPNSMNDWETWEVNIEDCLPTDHFTISKFHEFLGYMIDWKNKESA
jgi:hypothetical protein|tara:strand:- start:1208 stop:1462 length:255 start_codon:yes stop_codon:yes gene_type:complete